jgi:hypothetical protein
VRRAGDDDDRDCEDERANDALTRREIPDQERGCPADQGDKHEPECGTVNRWVGGPNRTGRFGRGRFGISVDAWQFLLSLPVIFHASSIFFRAAVSALKARTLDMMVLVAVAIGTGWIYSVAATFFITSEVFYEAAAFLAAFVLLGHWLEMRARGGANDAIRTLLDPAPSKAVVLRNGDAVEVPSSEVALGDLLLIRPGGKVRSMPRRSTARARSMSRW